MSVARARRLQKFFSLLAFSCTFCVIKNLVPPMTCSVGPLAREGVVLRLDKWGEGLLTRRMLGWELDRITRNPRSISMFALPIFEHTTN